METFSNEISKERTKIVSSMIKLVFKKDLSWENLATILDEMSSNLSNSKQIITILLQEMKDLHARIQGSQYEKITWDQHDISLDFETNATELEEDIEEAKRNDEGSERTQNEIDVDFLSDNKDLESFDGAMVMTEQNVQIANESLINDNDEFQHMEQIDELSEKDEELVKQFENQYYVFVGDEKTKEGKTDDIQKIDKEICKTSKNFKCPICCKSYKKQKALKIHEKVHTGKRPYKCNYCQKSFKENTNLNSHERIHTGEKPFQCKECGNCFRQKEALTTHERIHTGERPFRCEDCGKCFGRIHTGEKPYICKYCKKSFADISNLFKHKRKEKHF